LLTDICNKLHFFTHQFGSHLTIQYQKNCLSHEVPPVLIGRSGISPRQTNLDFSCKQWDKLNMLHQI
jgi:hypothetical protein